MSHLSTLKVRATHRNFMPRVVGGVVEPAILSQDYDHKTIDFLDITKAARTVEKPGMKACSKAAKPHIHGGNKRQALEYDLVRIFNRREIYRWLSKTNSMTSSVKHPI
jgi:hypothetical protein